MSDDMKDKSSSSTNIGDNNQIGDGNVIGSGNVVGNGNIINQGNNVTYEGEKEDVAFFQKNAPRLIRKYGREKLGIVEFVSFIAGIITIATWFNSSSGDKLVPYFPSIAILNSPYVLIFGCILILIGAIILGVLNYHSVTRCKECKKDFAYIEFKNPKVEEIKTSKGTRISTTRYYKCKFCGHENTTSNTVIEEDDKNNN
jgi:hypothetical protein